MDYDVMKSIPIVNGKWLLKTGLGWEKHKEDHHLCI